MKRKKYKTTEYASKVEEPVIIYGQKAVQKDGSTNKTTSTETIYKSDRMTVEEYFGIIHTMIDDYYDNL